MVRAGEERSGEGTLAVALWGSPTVSSEGASSCGVVRLLSMTFQKDEDPDLMKKRVFRVHDTGRRQL